MNRKSSSGVRQALSIAMGSLLLAGAATLSRASRSDPDARPLLGHSRGFEPDARVPGGPAEDWESIEPLSMGSLESRVAEWVARLKAEASLEGATEDLASALSEMLQSHPLIDVLAHLSRLAPLEEGFSVLRQLVAERPALRESILRIVSSAGGDQETRLFALRLLPPFARLGSQEKDALLRLGDRDLNGELGRQIVRYVGKVPTEDGVGAWLSRLLERSGDPEAQTEALEALVRCPDPMAVSTLKRSFEDPDVPVFHRARILALLSAPGSSQGAYARYPWLPEALERSIRLRPGVALNAAERELAFYAATILAQNGDDRKLARLMESEPCISDPGGRALIAFALRWLPEENATATLASMASNPVESPKVRLIALESLSGRKIAGNVHRLQLMASERDVPEDIKAALEGLLRK